MARITTFLYGLGCYAVFFVTYLYMVGWVTGLVAPTALDGSGTAPLGLALTVNIGLVLLFALQHSVMARPWFKRWWTQFVPEPAERSTYCLLSSVALILLFVFWQPMPLAVWEVQGATARAVLHGISLLGFTIVLCTSFLIDHFDLFGLRQVWLHLRGEPYTHHTFKTPGLYRYVRHPLYVGWLTAAWAAPTMTIAHLLFAGLLSTYILVAIVFEERDLVDHFGDEYREYQETTSMLVPLPPRVAA